LQGISNYVTFHFSSFLSRQLVLIFFRNPYLVVHL
jgi:hypothetical protein